MVTIADQANMESFITDKNSPSSPGGLGGVSLSWVDINKRILEIEKQTELTKRDVKEWNILVTKRLAGVLKREKKDEKDIGQTKKEERREEETTGNNAQLIHGDMVQKEALL